MNVVRSFYETSGFRLNMRAHHIPLLQVVNVDISVAGIEVCVQLFVIPEEAARNVGYAALLGLPFMYHVHGEFDICSMVLKIKERPNSDKEALLHGSPYKPLPLIADDKLITDNSFFSGYVIEEDDPSDEEYDAEYDAYQSITFTDVDGVIFNTSSTNKAHHVCLCTLHLDLATSFIADYMSVEYVSAVKYAAMFPMTELGKVAHVLSQYDSPLE